MAKRKTKLFLSVPERHRLNIARQTLKLSDVGARIMGGMTKDEARAYILRITGKPAKEEPEEKTCPGHTADTDCEIDPQNPCEACNAAEDAALAARDQRQAMRG